MSKKNPTAEEIAELFGFDVEEVKEKIVDHGLKAAEQRSLAAEAVRDRLYNPEGWYDKKCKFCGKTFSTTYKYVALCSDKCRKADFEAIGLIWDPTKSEEDRYIAMKIQPPAVVPPLAFSALLQLARQYSASALISPGVNTQT